MTTEERVLAVLRDGLVPIVVIVVAALGAGCVRVAPYQRGHLAARIMEAPTWPVLDEHEEHLHEVREGTGGATGTASGGCGCN
jgi:hypothetical protein